MSGDKISDLFLIDVTEAYVRSISILENMPNSYLVELFRRCVYNAKSFGIERTAGHINTILQQNTLNTFVFIQTFAVCQGGNLPTLAVYI